MKRNININLNDIKNILTETKKIKNYTYKKIKNNKAKNKYSYVLNFKTPIEYRIQLGF